MSVEAVVATNLSIHFLIGSSPQSEFDLAEIVEKGIPTDSIAYLRHNGLTFSEVSSIVISPRTLKHRKARGEKLSNEEAERAIRVGRVLAQAESVFGSHDKALLWLRTPDERLNNRTPLSMLPTEAGGRLVESMLWQIDDGVYT
jgi:putative toxin-antitoxin system antitoxin component (TIGR02293 family)